MTMKQVADIAKVVPSAVNKWKAGAQIRFSSLLRLADYFGVPVESFASGDVANDAEYTATKLSLADFRRERGLTQQQLADAVGVSRNYIALVENGRKPFSDSLRRKLSLVNTPDDNQPAPAAPCPLCAEKDGEIAWLRRQLSKAQDSLAALAAPPPAPPAAPACGARCGADDRRAGRKEA